MMLAWRGVAPLASAVPRNLALEARVEAAWAVARAVVWTGSRVEAVWVPSRR